MPELNTQTPARQAAMNGLAVVGFIALIAVGLFLAVSASRFVPNIVNGLGSAAVYLGSVFAPGPSSPAAIATSTPFETSTSTISFGTEATTTEATSTPAPKPYRPPVSRTPGPESTGTYALGTSTPAAYYGLPDLIVRIDTIGYLATTSAESFVASSTVPAGSRPAVRFTIVNVGTNVAAPWRFSASIPTSSGFIFQSQPQQMLAPGDSIQYTLGFDQPKTGLQTISVTANFDKAVAETNPDNNSASANLTILGS